MTTWRACSSESKQISEWFDRRAADVYDYASDPANLPKGADPPSDRDLVGGTGLEPVTSSV
jgi:hypothetical protein